MYLLLKTSSVSLEVVVGVRGGWRGGGRWSKTMTLLTAAQIEAHLLLKIGVLGETYLSARQQLSQVKRQAFITSELGRRRRTESVLSRLSELRSRVFARLYRRGTHPEDVHISTS